VSGRLRRYRGTGKSEKRWEYRPDVLVMGADGVKKKKVRCDRNGNEPACDGTRMRCNEKWAGQEQARRKQVETPHGPTMGIRSQSCHPHTKVGLVFPLNNDIVTSGQCKVKTTENGEIGTKECLFLAPAFSSAGEVPAGARTVSELGMSPGRSALSTADKIRLPSFQTSKLQPSERGKSAYGCRARKVHEFITSEELTLEQGRTFNASFHFLSLS
jgi:hypothetical protein